MKRIYYILLSLCLSALPANALADCLVDTRGIVRCASTPTGGALLNRKGEVVCGRGQCEVDAFGVTMCSNVEGGGAGLDRSGAVKCLGGCERASTELCVDAR